jgi:hypothetical protein
MAASEVTGKLDGASKCYEQDPGKSDLIELGLGRSLGIDPSGDVDAARSWRRASDTGFLLRGTTACLFLLRW